MSPSGTVVTLSNRNGGPNANVFNGTLWDDQAGGDSILNHFYTNNVVASPLVAQEPLVAFYGENPNGIWTLTITDVAGGDVGMLNSWTLHMTTLPSPPIETTTTFANTTAVNISDFSTVTSTMTVSGAGTFLGDLDLTTFITHTYAADLNISVMSPSGTVVTLSNRNGGPNANVFNGTLWDDQAGSDSVLNHFYANNVVAPHLVPQELLAAFIGEDPNGVWTLTITDVAGGDVGMLNSWTLDLTTYASEVSPKVVSIDVKPGSVLNSMNPNSKGVTPVAILTTATFDAKTVDPATVLFGRTGVEALPAHSALEDVDGDADLDMILHFKTQNTDIHCGDVQAILTGETLHGEEIQGSDVIRTTGCK